jgi:putative tryptophan/tyrosine transport system substrate-binding protein
MAIHIRRREFILTIGGASAWPLTARAQQGERVRRIGVLSGLADGDPEGQARVVAFRQGLHELGWIEGRNIRIDIRWAGASSEHLRTYSAELVAMGPDVILAAADLAAAALRQTTRTVPIVFAQLSDPVGSGFVASLARPGGNITGFATTEYAIGVKWLELLKQIAPQVVRAAVVYDPVNAFWPGYLHEIETGAPLLGVEVAPLGVHSLIEIEHAIDEFAHEPGGGLIALPGPTVLSLNLDHVVALAAKRLLPAVYPYRFCAMAGGLAYYGVDNIDLYRRAASYVDRILKGERPGDLPVQLATKYELGINLKTAKALGLDVPITLLARTDEVIE